MPTVHPTPEILDRLLTGTVTDAESRWVVQHLVARCDVCSRYLRGALDALDPRQPAGRYDAAYAVAMDRSASGLAAMRAEQLEATTLWASIRDTPPARRLDLILGDPRYHTWAVAERFLEAAADSTGSTPRAASTPAASRWPSPSACRRRPTPPACATTCAPAP